MPARPNAIIARRLRRRLSRQPADSRQDEGKMAIRRRSADICVGGTVAKRRPRELGSEGRDDRAEVNSIAHVK
jgi:hypothetical protein